MEVVVRRWLLVALAACSSKKQQPPPAHGSGSGLEETALVGTPLPPGPETAPIDLPSGGITKLRAGRSTFRNGLAVRWSSPKQQDAAITCRIEVYNLVSAGAPDNDNAGAGEQAAFYHADPFELEPRTCEIELVETEGRLVSTACYRGGKLTEGSCPDGTFPPPKLPAKMTVSVEGASVHAGGTTLDVDALLTVTKQLSADASLQLRCDGVASEPQNDIGAFPLTHVQDGKTVYVQSPFTMKRPFAKAPAACELTVVDHKPLGTFCIHEGSTEPGPCPK